MRIRNASLSMDCLLVLTLALLIHGFGCTRACRVDTYTTDEKTVITRMTGDEIGTSEGKVWVPSTFGRYGRNTVCHLDAQRCQHPDGTVTYDLLLTLRWSGTGTLDAYHDMPTRESLTLVIDGKSVRLWPKGELHREKDELTHRVTDSWSYPVSADVLSQMASANAVDLNVSGQGGTLIRYFNKHNIAGFKEFWDKYGNAGEQMGAPRQ